MRILKWTIAIIIITPLAFLFAMWIVVPWFWQAAYSGDGEYKVYTDAPFLNNFKLTFPDFKLNEESTVTYRIKHLKVNNYVHFKLDLNSNAPVPFSLLDTIVSVSLKNSDNQIIYQINAPLNSHNKLCEMPEEEFREWQQSNSLVWYGDHCKVLDTNEVYQTNNSFYAFGRFGEPVILWWEEYELTISVKQPDKTYGDIKAQFEISSGWK